MESQNTMIRYIAKEFPPGLQWENKHFGYTSISCEPECDYQAVFYYNGRLRAFCANPSCYTQGQYSLSAKIFEQIPERGNEDKLRRAIKGQSPKK